MISLGFTAAGATVPAGILTLADAKARMEHHKAELMRAWSDYYAGARCTVRGNELGPSMMIQPGADACLIFYARRSGDDHGTARVDLRETQRPV